jgi:multiple sugar transport system substrate-binding protein
MKRSLSWVSAAMTAALLVAPSVMPQAHAAPAKAPVTLTLWTWVPSAGLQPAIDLFNKTHPGIVVKQTYNVGPPTIYTKYFTVIQAKKGAPDIAQIEYDWLPTYEYLGNGALVDMGKYGGNAIKSQFPAGVWSQVSVGNSVYGIPQDVGPMGMYYRKDLFAKYHIAVPKTWAEYASAAAALHKADPNLYITNFSSAGGDFAQWASYMWQAGGNWFSSNGSSWSVNINSATNKQVMSYWGNLASQGLLLNVGNFTQAQYKAWNSGQVATWLCAVWGANTILSNAPATSGDWAMAPMPQWTAGKYVTSAWGGSATVVMSQTQHPKEATEFALWLSTNQGSLKNLISGAQLFPAQSVGQKNPAFTAPYKFYSGQSLAGTFIPASKALVPGFQWGPVISVTSTKFDSYLNNAFNAKTDFGAVLDATQKDTITYMKSQGFTVQ